jgi:hypothetical protein
MHTGTLEKCALHGWIPVSTVPGRWQTTCIVLSGWAVCWCQHYEQSTTWWGYGIGTDNETQLYFIDGNLNAQRYRDEILMPIIMPFNRCHHLRFQHYNAQPHVSMICTQFLEAENDPVLPWLAYSPDMWPIEHVHQFRTAIEGVGITCQKPQSTVWSTLCKWGVMLHEANGHTRYRLVFWSMPLPFFFRYLYSKSHDIHRLGPNLFQLTDILIWTVTQSLKLHVAFIFQFSIVTLLV